MLDHENLFEILSTKRGYRESLGVPYIFRLDPPLLVPPLYTVFGTFKYIPEPSPKIVSTTRKRLFFVTVCRRFTLATRMKKPAIITQVITIAVI